MKKTAIILSIILSPFLVTAQAFFDKYEDMDQVVSVVINQKMFEMLGDVETNDADSESFTKMVKSLKNLTVYTTSSLKVTKSLEKDIAKFCKVPS